MELVALVVFAIIGFAASCLSLRISFALWAGASACGVGAALWTFRVGFEAGDDFLAVTNILLLGFVCMLSMAWFAGLVAAGTWRTMRREEHA